MSMSKEEMINEISVKIGINNQYLYAGIVKLTRQQIRQREASNKALRKELDRLNKLNDDQF